MNFPQIIFRIWDDVDDVDDVEIWTIFKLQLF